MPSPNVIVHDRQTFPFVMLPKAFFTGFHPTANEILAFVALKYYGRTDSETCEAIGIKTLAARVGVSESTMKRTIASLTSKKILKVTRRSRKSAAGDRIPIPNLYTLSDLQAIGGEPI